MTTGEVIALIKAFGGGSGGGSSGGGVLVVNVDENYTFDKTWQEIHDASFAVIKWTSGNNSFTATVVTVSKIKNIQSGDYVYRVQFWDGEQSSRAETDSPSGYPVFVDE
jgi:hypothetical protein